MQESLIGDDSEIEILVKIRLPNDPNPAPPHPPRQHNNPKPTRRLQHPANLKLEAKQGPDQARQAPTLNAQGDREEIKIDTSRL